MKSYSKNECIDVKITDVAEKDRWFGRLADGIGVFVKGAAAIGDLAHVQIIKIKKKHLETRLLEIIDPSSYRVEPPCSHFGVCGGCKWQHIEYSEQLRLKGERTRHIMMHVGGFPDLDVPLPLAATHQTRYRNKIEFSFSTKRYLLQDELAKANEELTKPVDFALGFHPPGIFYKVVDIDYCHIVTPEMNLVLETVKKFCIKNKLTSYSTMTHEGYLRHLMIRQSRNTNDLMVNLVTSTYDPEIVNTLASELRSVLNGAMTTFVNNVTTKKCESAQGEKEYVISGSGTILEYLGNYQFQISADSFFQTNTECPQLKCF